MRFAATVVLTFAISGCQGTPTLVNACPMASAGGTLVADGENLVLAEPAGHREVVGWPDGVRVARVDGRLALIGFFGQVIAREGDQIAMAGGIAQDGIFHGCGEISRQGP